MQYREGVVCTMASDFMWTLLSRCQPDTAITNLLNIAVNSRDRLKAAAFLAIGTFTVQYIKNPQTIIKRYISSYFYLQFKLYY